MAVELSSFPSYAGKKPIIFNPKVYPNTVRQEPTVLSTVSLATHDEFSPLANGLPR